MSLSKKSLLVLAYGRIGWVYSHNTRQDDASYTSALSDLAVDLSPKKDQTKEDGPAYSPNKDTREGLVVPLLGGWDSSQGAVKVITIAEAARLYSTPLKTLTEADILKMVKEDREKWVSVWDQQDATRPLAETARKVWQEEPQYIACCMYRRSIGIMGAIHRAMVDGKASKPQAYDVPVVVTQFPTLAELIESNIRENEGKDIGRKAYAPLDYLRQAVMLANTFSGRESNLRKGGVRDGTAQKVWRMAMLNRKFPTLNLADRCFQQEGTEGYIPFSKVGKEPLQKLLTDHDPIADGKVPAVVDAAYVNSYFAKLGTAEAKNVVKRMNDDTAKQIMNGGSRLVAAVLKAYYGNDTQFFARVQQWSSSPVNASMEEMVLKDWLPNQSQASQTTDDAGDDAADDAGDDAGE